MDDEYVLATFARNYIKSLNKIKLHGIMRTDNRGKVNNMRDVKYWINQEIFKCRLDTCGKYVGLVQWNTYFECSNIFIMTLFAYIRVSTYNYHGVNLTMQKLEDPWIHD